ncbi:hypothetical protein P22_0652 [Propionispora sp. 2/2-37]|uniref:ribulose-phosphate 3-epimerase n=1 Tax=Propionispora sp. 2/2-37 TaxID=1677858 RepID=UPI0006BB7D98|nr:ribulose-phosphate 3-epimerase [Propionispora sp. 2/2-37]CUH94586.1 hypothetical protein P22_0652 [Propionispora sp. 2/2-37]
MSIKISPSILGANFCNLEQDIKVLEKNSVPVLHLDVMDGHFVPNITFGPDQIKMLRSVTSAMEFDAHLMVTDADALLSRLAEAKVDSVTVHAEACVHLYRTLDTIKKLGMKTGVALNPATPADTIKHVASMLDRVLIMTVEPGFGGQKFIPLMLDKISGLSRWKQEQGLTFDIQVDGGINLANIAEVVRQGASDIVIGSSIFSGGSIEKNVQAFYAALK